MQNFILNTKRFSTYQFAGQKMVQDAQSILKLHSIRNIEEVHTFEFHQVNEKDIETIKQYFSTELNELSFEPIKPQVPYFHIKAVEGQHDDILEMVKSELSQFHNINVDIKHSIYYLFDQADADEVARFKAYFVNEVEFVDYDTKYIIEDTSSELKPISGFIEEDNIQQYKESLGMDLDDLKVVQDYFKTQDRNPSLLELKIIDTYWSDHCRHTTFLTHFNNIEIKDERVQKVYESYLETRDNVFGKKTQRAQTLMDLATINAREIEAKGYLKDWDKSSEVNAVSLNLDLEVNGKIEPWQLLFKNETHNHPTEIEPYGGASTCFGGCVRDPLSGRGTVYQGLRISGSKSPLTSFENTRKDKLMASQISQQAAEGFSDYANQMGIKSGYLCEYYHDGFEAKRLELGALVAAVRRDYIQKTVPQKGDVVLLLGGKTGRDGLGAAVGSSKTQTKSSLKTVGAEVQKGNPILEHKITRLFRDRDVLSMIKRCNDFGAGGVSVAVGELADGLLIELDKVHTKYPLLAGEIALSESQERMAVVIEAKDVERFMKYCEAEDVEVSKIATVTDDQKMTMLYKNEVVVSMDRSFLDSNGATKRQDIKVEKPKPISLSTTITQEKLLDSIRNIHGASLRGLREKFNIYHDENVDNRISQEGMTHLFPTSNTQHVSFMSAGYALAYTEDAYLHGRNSVIESISRLLAMGANPNHARLSMQEYFERLKTQEQWGKPFAALLGAFEVMKAWDIPALGGKDSMSGSFEELNVPSTLICFAVQTGKQKDIITRNIKGASHKLVLIDAPKKDGLIDLEKTKILYDEVFKRMQNNEIYAASTVTKSIFNSLFEMSLGSDYGIDIHLKENLLEPKYGALILEVDADFDLGDAIATTQFRKKINVLDTSFDKESLQIEHEATLNSIYPILQTESQTITYPVQRKTFEKRSSKLKALIVVMEGVSGDLQLKLQLEQAGIEVLEKVVQTFNFEKSMQEIKNALEKSDCLILAHGFTKDMQIKVSGSSYVSLLTHPILKVTFEKFVASGKMVIGLGSGAVALCKMNLVGDVKLMPIGKHHVNLETVVIKENHPGFKDCLGNVINLPYLVPFVFENADERFAILKVKEKVKNASNITGLQKGNVLALLGSIDQINTEFFKNINTYTMEEK